MLMPLGALNELIEGKLVATLNGMPVIGTRPTTRLPRTEAVPDRLKGTSWVGPSVTAAMKL